MRRLPSWDDFCIILLCAPFCACISVCDGLWRRLHRKQDVRRRGKEKKKPERRKKADQSPPKGCKIGNDLIAPIHITNAETSSSFPEGCLILSLPVEIRILIYRNLCGAREEILIVFSGRGLSGQGDPYLPRGGQSISIIPLMLTCRRIYADVVNTVYSVIKYTFPHPAAFLAFCGSLPPRHFQQLRKIRLDFIQRSGYHDSLRDLVHSQISFGCLHRCDIKTWYNSKALELEGRKKYEKFGSRSGPEISKSCEIGSFWTRVCLVLSRMGNLNDVRADMTWKQAEDMEQVLKPLEILDGNGLSSVVIERMPKVYALGSKIDKWTRIEAEGKYRWLHEQILIDEV